MTEADAEFRCVRCHGAGRLDRPPMPGETGAEVHARICTRCWREWEHTEVMVINELRLNFMDPRAQEILHRHMREFLGLAPPSAERG